MIEDKSLTYRDFADFLKTEVSDILPSKEKYIKEFVVKVRGIVERKYGKYFGINTLNRVRGLEDRVVNFYPGSFSKYLVLMGSDLKQTVKGVRGAYTRPEKGSTIGLASTKTSIRDKGASEDIDVIVKTANKTRKEAVEIYESMTLRHNVIHEMVHAYQRQDLPNYFDECAAPFYTLEVQRELQYLSLFSLNSREMVRFYEFLVNSFGEDIHGLFFGKVNKDKAFRGKVFSLFTPEILSHLFPEGLGTTKEELSNFGKEFS